MGNTQGSIRVLKYLLNELEQLEELQKKELAFKIKEEQKVKEEEEKQELLSTLKKNCKGCKLEKLLSEYHKDKTRKDNKKSICKVCVKKSADSKKEEVSLP